MRKLTCKQPRSCLCTSLRTELTRNDARHLAALLTRAGWVEPDTIRDVYDAAAAGWFGYDHPTVDLTRGTGAASPALWPKFWEFIDDTTKMDAGAEFLAKTW